MKKLLILFFLSACVAGSIYNANSTPTSKVPVSYSSTIAGGPYHYFVVKNNEELVSWGDNQWGALGREKNYPDTPMDSVKVLDNIYYISTSELYSLGIDIDNGLWAWGNENIYDTFKGFKEYGYGHNQPAKIMDDVVMASVGSTVLVVKQDYSLWGWGSYIYGNLGDGRYNKYLVDGIGEIPAEPPMYTDIEKYPVKIMDDVCFALSADCQYAIKNDGSLWAWGYNNYGALGDGTTETKVYPVKIMDDVKFISQGPYAIKTDNSLWTWGKQEIHNNLNEIQKEELLPRKIMDNVSFASTFDGGQSVVIQEDGSMWIWGNNDLGQLGDGTQISRSEPVKVLDDAVCAVGNTFSTMAIKKDGSLWYMGMYNDAGGSLIYRPHKVMDNVMLPQPLIF